MRGRMAWDLPNCNPLHYSRVYLGKGRGFKPQLAKGPLPLSHSSKFLRLTTDRASFPLPPSLSLPLSVARVSVQASVRIYGFVGKSPSGQTHCLYRDTGGIPCAGYSRRRIADLPIPLGMALPNYMYTILRSPSSNYDWCPYSKVCNSGG